MIWKRSGHKAASAHRALTLLLEHDGKVVFEISTAAMAKPIVIGRGVGCDWCTSGVDASISGRHAEIYLRHGAPHIRDLGSRNGIYHHGQRVQDIRLSPGDTVLIGACSLSAERPAAGTDPDGQQRHHRLEQLNGPDAGRIFDLVGPSDIRIGSDPSCSIVCLDTLVSHEHAVIAFKQDGSCWVSDLGSRNGSAVNGVPLKKERMLCDGDVLTIAYVEFRFHDKNVVHASANVGRKMAVIAATTTIALMLFFIYNSLTPSARTYMEAARKCAAEERFDQALENLDKAMVARYAAAYGNNIRELKSDVVGWTNTLANWRSVQALLEGRKWVSARALFHNMNDWRWNNDKAPAEMEKAARAERLVAAFLDSRELLKETAWKDDVPEKFREMARELRERLAAIGEKPDKFAMPLAENAADVLRELEATIGDFDGIARLQRTLDEARFDLAELDNPVGRRTLADLSALMSSNASRGEDRHAQSQSNNFNVCRFSEIPGQRMAALRDVVAKYDEAEKALFDNMVRFAREQYGDVVADLSLHLPPRDVCGKFGISGYRDSLEEANRTLVLRGGGLRTQMNNLRRAGFDFERGLVNRDFAKLLDPATTRGVLRFVSPSDTPVREDSPEPSCVYDEVVGVFAFGDFLAELRDDGTGITDAVEDYGEDNGVSKWTPLLRRARDAFGVLERFQRTIGEDRSGFLGRIAALGLSEGENRVMLAKEFSDRQRKVFRNWVVDAFPMACEADGSPRARILSKGVSLILSAQPSELAAAALSVEWTKFRRNVPKEVRGTLAEWQDIVFSDIPRRGKFMSAWKSAHEALEREKAEGGVE